MNAICLIDLAGMGMLRPIMPILTVGQFAALTSLLHGDGIGGYGAIISSPLTPLLCYRLHLKVLRKARDEKIASENTPKICSSNLIIYTEQMKAN